MIPLITEGARFTLGLSIVACVLGLGIATALALGGRHAGAPVAASRGLVWALVSVLVLLIVLLLLLIYVLHRSS